MKQYCRYCTGYMNGNGSWCEYRMMEISEERAKRVNKCKEFAYTPIDAFTGNEYRPMRYVSHKQTIDGQISVDEILERGISDENDNH